VNGFGDKVGFWLYLFKKSSLYKIVEICSSNYDTVHVPLGTPQEAIGRRKTRRPFLFADVKGENKAPENEPFLLFGLIPR